MCGFFRLPEFTHLRETNLIRGRLGTVMQQPHDTELHAVLLFAVEFLQPLSSFTLCVIDAKLAEIFENFVMENGLRAEPVQIIWA